MSCLAFMALLSALLLLALARVYAVTASWKGFFFSIKSSLLPINHVEAWDNKSSISWRDKHKYESAKRNLKKLDLTKNCRNDGDFGNQAVNLLWEWFNVFKSQNSYTFYGNTDKVSYCVTSVFKMLFSYIDRVTGS